MLAAKAMGADTIIMTGTTRRDDRSLKDVFFTIDISQSRLDFAKKMGANHILLAEGDAQKLAQQVVETLGTMPNISIECSGAESSIQTTFYVRRRISILVLLALLLSR